MGTMRLLTATAICLALAIPAAAQQPPRPADTARTVTLSLAEFNRLTDLASAPTATTPSAPVASVLAAAEMRVRVDRDVARGIFNLTGDVLRQGLNRVDLLAGSTLIDAAAGGRPLPLLSDGTRHWALLPGPGPFTATIEWGSALTLSPGRASFSLPVPPAGTARTTIDIPGEQADLRISPGLITRRTAAGGRTIIEATLDPGSTTEVSWSMRDSAPVAAAREARSLADVLTLVTLGDSDVRMAAIVDITVVYGEPRSFDLQLPAGYEVTSIAGSSIESSDARGNVINVVVSSPSSRRHQFLVGLERAHTGGTLDIQTELLTLPNIQRERGEIAIEGVGTLELAAAESDGVQRIDVRELSAPLRSLARSSLLSAFRYQGKPGTPRTLSMNITRFGDAGVLAAVADRATVTTLVNAEGRALTEVVLQVQNRAQPFVKIMLPTGASIVSVEVAGETAKPALGQDGTRIPLLRQGFRPQGAYTVSFVYLHASAPLVRKGDLAMALPRMDIPVSLVEWEIFVPERFKVRAVGGNAIERVKFGELPPPESITIASVTPVAPTVRTGPANITGRVTDATGAALSGVTITLAGAPLNGSPRSLTTDHNGAYTIPNVPAGSYMLTMTLAGFTETSRDIVVGAGASMRIDGLMRLIGAEESVLVHADSAVVSVMSSARMVADLANAQVVRQQQPSQNVINLQRRASGVLPVRMDVPRAGTSHQFVRLLAIDETVVNLRYQRR